MIYFSSYKLFYINNKIKFNELCVSKEISASETTSKIFCHYIKNEVLAIQSELTMIGDIDKQLLNSVLKRCDILYSRIDEIHKSTKTTHLNLHLCSLQTLIKNVLNEFSLDLENINTNLILPEADIYAMLDETYMTQSLINIIDNAVDAMKNTVCKNLCIQLLADNNWVQIQITDTGKGITKENLDKIFLPFYSSYTYSKHWGIGLTLAYKIIHAHEGKIYAESTHGIGTTFFILLPKIQTH